VPLSRSGFSTAVESVGFDPNGHGIFGSYRARYVKKGEGVYLFLNKKFTAILKEACKLVESGFGYITDIDGVTLFRKRK